MYRRLAVVARVLLLALLLGLVLPGAVLAQDDAPTVALHDGSCDVPGALLAELAQVKARGGDDGTFWTSFTTVDRSLAELTGAAVVVQVGEDVAACGEAPGGTKPDRYVALVARAESDFGGIAWLHADDGQTRVTVFLARGLAGGTPPDGPPEPPVDDETPVPPTPTPPVAAPTPTPAVTAGCEGVADWFAATAGRIKQADAIVAKLPLLIPTIAISSGPTFLNLGATFAVLAAAQREGPTPDSVAEVSDGLAAAMADLGELLTTVGNRLNSYDPGYVEDLVELPPLQEAYATAKAQAEAAGGQCDGD